MGEIEYNLKNQKTGVRHGQGGVLTGALAENNKHKALSVLLGALEGIISDGVIKPEEINFIHDWLLKYSEVWPDCALSGVFLGLRDELEHGNLKKKDINLIKDAILKVKGTRKTFLVNQDTSVDYFHGIVKGILSDKLINQKELDFLNEWLSHTTYLPDDWFYRDVRKELKKIARGAVITPETKHLLLKFLRTVSGEKEEMSSTQLTSTKIPIDNPAPLEVIIEKTTFSLTGMFKLGPRSEIVKKIESKGGVFKSHPVRGGVLVIGDFASRDWKYSSHGEKIRKAIDLRDNGGENKIISEDYLKYLLSEK
ncbi:MAG: hypothetical protein EBR01_12840 [Proteobacteria bacterium]|nr:hypothetical protein [Pseudomonadota bacterium]